MTFWVSHSKELSQSLEGWNGFFLSENDFGGQVIAKYDQSPYHSSWGKFSKVLKDEKSS